MIEIIAAFFLLVAIFGILFRKFAPWAAVITAAICLWINFPNFSGNNVKWNPNLLLLSSALVPLYLLYILNFSDNINYNLFKGKQKINICIKKVGIFIYYVIIVYYLYYNSPVIAQIYASSTFDGVRALSVEKGMFNCASASVNRTDSMLDRNEYIFRGGGLSGIKYKYKVDDRIYENRRNSYVRSMIFCGEDVIDVYYYPLFPEMSIVDNSLPEGEYMEKFYFTTWLVIAMILARYSFLIVSRGRDEKPSA